MPRSSRSFVLHSSTLVVAFLMVFHNQSLADAVLDAVTEDDAPLHCRVTMDDTLYYDYDEGHDGDDENNDAATSGRTAYSIERVSCAPLRDDGTEDVLFALEQIPAEIHKSRVDDIRMGRLYLSITQSSLDAEDNVVVTQPTSAFTVLDGPPPQHREERGRHLRKAHTDALGIRRYAVVRVSTSDASPSASAGQLRSRYTDPRAGMQAQYAACSVNQLRWELDGVYEVRVTGSVRNYVNRAAHLRNDAANLLRDRLGLNNINELADNILFCIPPGTGNWGKYIYIKREKHMTKPSFSECLPASHRHVSCSTDLLLPKSPVRERVTGNLSTMTSGVLA